MNRNSFILLLIGLLGITSLMPLNAQDQTVGLFINEDGAFEGYTFFAPIRYTTTYLIDMQGRLVHKWESNYTPGLSVYLLENGNLLRTAKVNNPVFEKGGGRVQIIQWDGTVIWDFEYSDTLHYHHHDVEMMPNGNVLMIAYEMKTEAEALAAGREPSLLYDKELWPDHIIEVEPDGATGGNIVWEWHIWDHLIQDCYPEKENYGVVEDHPELMDINYVFSISADWNHTNAIDYNGDLDQILICLHQMCEVCVIDHSTTTEEAAGHTGGNSGKGGDFLYRWGNPRVYGRGGPGDQKFHLQHDAQWIEPSLPGSGNMLIFNNGNGRPARNYSSIDEIVPPVDSVGNYILETGSPFGPDEVEWIYTADSLYDFYAKNISGTQRLANGNTLICDGPKGCFFELTPENEIVWRYVNPVTNNGPLSQGDTIPLNQDGDQLNVVFRCYRYAPDYPGLEGHDLTPGDPIELNPWISIKPGGVHNKNIPLQVYQNSCKSSIKICFTNPDKNARLKIYSIKGEELLKCKVCTDEYTWHTNDVPSGMYIIAVTIGGRLYSGFVTLVK